MNKKVVQLIHSELDIKHKKSLNKTKCKNEKEFSNDIRQIKKENCTLNITWEPLRISNIQFTGTAILPLPKRKTWDCFLQRMVFTQSIIKHYLEISGPKYTYLTTIRSKSLKPHQVFFFYLGFLSQTLTNHRTAGEEGGHFFNSSPLLPASQILRR